MQKIFKSVIFLFFLFTGASLAEAAGPGDVIITEIKIGEDGRATNEFIELYNKSGADIDFAGWSLKKKTSSGSESNLVSSAKFAGTIKANGFFLISHPDFQEAFKSDMPYSGASYSISSNNTVILYDGEMNTIDKAGFGEASDFEGAAAAGPENGQSLARIFSDGVFRDTDDNSADFIILTAPDPQNSASQLAGVNQTADTSAPASEEPAVSETQGADRGYAVENISAPSAGRPAEDHSSEIIVSEIFPNPFLGDLEEWIELYNKGEYAVELTGWRIGDASGRQYAIATGTVIKAGCYLVIYRKDSKLILDNDSDSVKLYKPGRTTAMETVKYKTAPEGRSYARDLSLPARWVWTKDITPGAGNIVEPANGAPEINTDYPSEASAKQPIIFDGSDSFDDDGDALSFLWDFGDGATSNLETAEHTFWKAGTYAVSLTVSDGRVETKKEKKLKIISDKNEIVAATKDKQAKTTAVKTSKTPAKATTAKSASAKSSSLDVAGENFLVGASRKMTGIVAVKPGVFGTQYFYMVGTPGIQVYSYKKDFPELKVGDRIEATGEISDNNGEARLKTKSRADIKILENRGVPESVRIACEELNADIANELVWMQGEVTGKKGQSAFIDDGSSEAEIYIKKGTGISMTQFKTGEQVTVTGLAVKYDGAYRLMPRSAEDIKTEKTGEVLGVAIEGDEWALAERDKGRELMLYILIIIGGVILVLGGWAVRKRFVN